MLPIDLTGKRALVAGVADDKGYGWAIVRALSAAGANVCVCTWPPTLKIFTKSLERGKLDMSLPGGGEIVLEKIYPLDAVFDTQDDVPEEVSSDKRYRELKNYSIQGVADSLKADFGEGCLDIVVHSLANGPEVRNPLIETSRAGYLAAVSASAYSMVSMIQRFGPLMNKGGALVSLSYLAAMKPAVSTGFGSTRSVQVLWRAVRQKPSAPSTRWLSTMRRTPHFLRPTRLPTSVTRQRSCALPWVPGSLVRRFM